MPATTLNVPPVTPAPGGWALSTDPYHWFSLSFTGTSTRTELWLMNVLVFVIAVVVAGIFEHSAPLLVSALFSVFFYIFIVPLIIRRAREFRSLRYGIRVLLLGYLPAELSDAYEVCCGAEVPELLEGFTAVVSLVICFPLFFLGGRYGGRKNALHRAAIAGDRAMAEALLTGFPAGIGLRSEGGYTAQEYARMQGYHELADWLQQRQEALEAEKETAAP